MKSTLKGERIKMKIAEDALDHIMDMLTEQYEDPELAIIREYSTNARDSHVEASQTRPIEITLPNHLNSFLTIKDYGTGLSVADIHEIYSQYGRITKDESNDFVGSLGIGCKSALAYTTQFTFVAIKNGVRCLVSVSRDEDGVASMTIVDTSITDEPNGVEITIPINRHNSIESKAREFFSYWDEGTVLINGETPKRIDGLKLADNLYLVQQGGYYRKHRVVMGNIPYPALFNIDEDLPDGYSIVAFVDIGDVHFAPAREGLKLSRKTKARLAQIENDVINGLLESIRQDIDDATDNYEAIEKYVHWQNKARNLLRNVEFTYKGVNIPKATKGALYDLLNEDGSVRFDKDGIKVQRNERLLVTDGGTRKLAKYSHTVSLDISFVPKTIFVYGYDKLKFNAYTKRKLHQWCDNQGHKYPNHFVLTQSKLDTTWISEDRMVSYEDIKATKLPRVNSPYKGDGRSQVRRVAKGTYDVFLNGVLTLDYPADEIKHKNLYYYAGKTGDAKAYSKALAINLEEYTLVCMWANRVKKFCREFPSALKVNDAAKAFYEAWKETIDLQDQLAIYVRSEDRNLAYFAAHRVDDPELKTAIELYNRDITKLKQAADAYYIFGGRSHLNVWNMEDTEWKSPLDNYPLLNCGKNTKLSYGIMEDVYIYVNAAYEARKDQSDGS